MSRLGAVVALLLALGLGGLALPSSAAAADPVFGRATATSTFGEGIEVDQPVTVPDGVTRVEALVRTGDANRTFLDTLPTPAVGRTTLRYTFATPSGALYPNTRVELGFRITLDDGRAVDGPTATLRYQDTRFAWQSIDGDLVSIHWYRGSDTFGRRALDIGEQAIRQASELLGVSETKPIDFYVYADRDAFYDVLGPGIRENVGGIALPEIRTLFANITPSDVSDPWVGVVVPHELTHLVFATATANPYHEPPHWLNEGLADHLAQGYTSGARSNVERAAAQGEIMPLHAIVGMFPTTADRFGLAYDESVSAIDYLIRTHGQEALVSLIRSYADGVSDDAAFEAALGVDAAGFEAGWLDDLGIDDPVPYGPLPAPAGPLPPDWAPAPNATIAPGVSAVPQPTFRPGPGPGSDLPGQIVLGVLGALAILLVVGLVVVARGLNRGDPLFAGAGARSEDGAAPNDDTGADAVASEDPAGSPDSATAPDVPEPALPEDAPPAPGSQR